ncbi:MAG: hypothetical protein ACKVIO_02660 [Phycisphaerales bacterium]|jgi:hypothetical protein|tara:strand:+ start:360 stop:560 length:201 start_codon:yes stop_codon:yes gene_type:complete
MMATNDKKPLARCLGEFIGHIVKAVKSDSSANEVKRTVEEKTEGNITLRRTTIEEIEIAQEDIKSD